MIRLLRHVVDVVKGKAPVTHPRSPHWSAFRRAWLEQHGECVACGTDENLQVHHISPFHVEPAKELDEDNVMTLCEGGHGERNCHLGIGHHGNFKLSNPHVREDAKAYRARLEQLKSMHGEVA